MAIRKKRPVKSKGLGAAPFILLGTVLLAIYGATRDSSSAKPVYTYTSGPVTLIVTGVDSHAQGFSFKLYVNNKEIFSDNVYSGDEEYTHQVGDYTVEVGVVNDWAAIFVYDKTGTQINPDAFELYYNGTKV